MSFLGGSKFRPRRRRQRRQISGFADPTPPPGINWRSVRESFNDAHRLISSGLDKYHLMARYISAGARIAGPQYEGVLEQAQRVQKSIEALMSKQSVMRDDLHTMESLMPDPDRD